MEKIVKHLNWRRGRMVIISDETANSLSDSYKMLRFIQKTTKEGLKIIGLCMGDYGRLTRTEGLKAGNYLNYTILHTRDKIAPGLILV